MRLYFAAIIVFTFFVMAFAKRGDRFVVSNNSFLALYENRERDPNESAIARVSNKELLEVISERGSHIKVRSTDGKKGWVKKWLVKPINISAEQFEDRLARSGKSDDLMLVFSPEGEIISDPIVPKSAFHKKTDKN